MKNLLKKFLDWWPLVFKSTHRRVQIENYILRDAIRNANAELLKHRTLIAGLWDGMVETETALKKVFEKPRT